MVISYIMKEIKNIEKTLKIGDEFQIEYTPKYNDKGEDQAEQKEILGYKYKMQVNERPALWDSKSRINKTGSLTYFDKKQNEHRTAIKTVSGFIKFILNNNTYIWKDKK